MQCRYLLAAQPSIVTISSWHSSLVTGGSTAAHVYLQLCQPLQQQLLRCAAALPQQEDIQPGGQA
jgi:hypothetical protein